MVIGREFVWAHLPKAGGEMTHALFELFPEVIEFADPRHTIQQHTAFTDRPEEIAGKKLVLNIRRLPSWMLSFHFWKSVEGLHPDFRPSPMLSPHEITTSNVADKFLLRYIGEGKPRVSVWLRTEHLIDDFLAFIADYAAVTEEKRLAAKTLPRVNELRYDKNISHWFTSAHIELMYRSNPTWSLIETSVYGMTLADSHEGSLKASRQS